MILISCNTSVIASGHIWPNAESGARGERGGGEHHVHHTGDGVNHPMPMVRTWVDRYTGDW